MKKNMYIAPNCEVVEIEMVSMIAASPSFGTDDDEYGETIETNRHRGEWGNLWDKR